MAHDTCDCAVYIVLCLLTVLYHEGAVHTDGVVELTVAGALVRQGVEDDGRENLAVLACVCLFVCVVNRIE